MKTESWIRALDIAELQAAEGANTEETISARRSHLARRQLIRALRHAAVMADYKAEDTIILLHRIMESHGVHD